MRDHRRCGDAGTGRMKERTPPGRAAFYRLQAERARKKAVTLADFSARETMLEVAKTLESLAAIEDRLSGQASQDKDP